MVDCLSGDGFKLVDRNWRRIQCEIDVIATKRGVVYFIEVKFRSQEYQGDGLAYITPRKLKQMKFAAELWCHENDWKGDSSIMAASVELSGGSMSVKELVEVL